MNLFKKLAKDSLWLLTARVGAQVSMVIVTYLLARRLGVAGFGEYAFIATAIVIGNALTTFGSDMYLIREIAAQAKFSELPSALALQLVLSFVFIAFVYLISPRLPNQTAESILALRVYSFALIPLAFFTVFTSALRGMQKMIPYAWLNLIIPILQFVAVSVFIQSGTGVTALVYLLLIIQILGAVAGGIFCSVIFPRFWRGLHFSFDKTISLFIACLPIAVIAILGIVYQKLSLTMLSFSGTTSVVGLFSAGMRVMEAMRIGHFAVFTVLYPAIANASPYKPLQRTFGLSWILLLLFSAGGSILIYWLAKPIVYIFFGVNYELSIPVLKILAFTLIPYTVNSFLSILFLVKKKEKIVLRVSMISLSMLLILNLWLIPFAGEVGASWAILIAEIMQAILFLSAWISDSSLRVEAVSSKGMLYELSDLP